MLIPLLLTGMISCSGANLENYFGDWQSTSNVNEIVEIKKADGVVSVEMIDNDHGEFHPKKKLKTFVTTDGKIVAVIKYPYATVLDIEPKTGYLKGGEFTYAKIGRH